MTFCFVVRFKNDRWAQNGDMNDRKREREIKGTKVQRGHKATLVENTRGPHKVPARQVWPQRTSSQYWSR
ncbi:hypothetical protein RB213_007428 [Colletotrichum asianum]